MQLSKCKATDAEKLLSSERNLLNAILRVKLKCMKNVSFSWNECYCNARENFHELELFAEQVMLQASMHRITSLELLRT